jgi:hypothetical protein
MKKLALLLLGVLLGFLLCYFFFGKQDMVDGEIADPKPPTGYVEPAEMKTLNNSYNERHGIINKALGIVDNRSSWYSLKDMRQFLDYAEFKASTGEHKMDGVRIYLGAKSGNKGLTTMFLVPTSSSVKIQDTYSKGSIFNFNLRAGGGDIPGAGGMDYGGQGNPPGSGYPNPPQ